ncbi:ubiquinol-cytochrome c reductase iron-sulfur subunit [Haloferacaceae archaeon DSL9]
MSVDDKYPAESGRRRFVKGVVGGATLAGLGAGTAGIVDSLTTSAGTGGGPIEAMVIERTGGPAPYGMPQIPLDVDDDGNLMGIWPEVTTETVQGVEVEIARQELGGRTYSQEWFQYCGNESYEQLDPNYDSDNYLLADSGGYEWQSEALSEGDQINLEDLADYEEWGNEIGDDGVGKPATATWRSEDSDSILPVTVVRSTLIEEAAQENEWVEASTVEGCVAWLNKCTHFCCVPGYKRTEDSARYGAENSVYCQCHQSVYDPFSLTSVLFLARPRADDGGE